MAVTPSDSRVHDEHSHKHQAVKQRKLVFLSVILFLLVFIAGSVFFASSMIKVVHTVSERELLQTVEIERLKLEVFANGEVALARKLASSHLLKRYFLDPDDAMLERFAFEEIADYRNALHSKTVFWIRDKDKKFYYDSNDSTYSYILDPKDPVNYWYNMTLYETEEFNFNINYNPDLRNLNFWINVPVFSNTRKALGILGTSVDLSAFISTIYKDYSGIAKLFLFNSAGEITGAKNMELVAAKKKIGDELGKAGLEIHARALELKTNEVQLLPDVTGVKGIVALATLPTLNWYAVAVLPIPNEEIKYSMIIQIFITAMVLSVIAFAVFNMFVMKLLKPHHKKVVK